MSRVRDSLPDPSSQLMHLWPLVNLVVELAERHGSALRHPPTNAASRHPVAEVPTSRENSEQGPHSPGPEVRNG